MSQTISNLLPSLFVNQIASATFGQPVHFITPVDFGTATYSTIHVTGKATFDGLIDPPTGLQLSLQPVNPGNAETIWVDNVNGLPQFGSNNMIVSAPGVTVNQIPNYTMDGVLTNSLITITGGNTLNIPGDNDVAGSQKCNVIVPHSSNQITVNSDWLFDGALAELSSVNDSLHLLNGDLHVDSGVIFGQALHMDTISKNLAANITIADDMLINTGKELDVDTIKINTLQVRSNPSITLVSDIAGSTSNGIFLSGGASVLSADFVQSGSLTPISGTQVNINSGDFIFDSVGPLLSSGAGSITLSSGTCTVSTLKADTINPNTTANLDIASIIEINGGVIPPNVTIQSLPLALGSGLTTPTNVSEGTLQLESLAGATYGNPVGSGLVYCDSDNNIKTKNTSGDIISISEKPYIGSIYNVTEGPQVITTMNTFTWVKPSNWTLDVTGLNGFTMLNDYQLQYIGVPSKICMLSWKANIKGTALDELQFIIYKNDAVNVNGEVTAGTPYLSSQSVITLNSPGYNNISGFTVATLEPNCTFALFVNNVAATNSVTIHDVLLSCHGFSAGTD